MGVSALVDAESHSKNANTSTNQLQGSDGQSTKTSGQRIMGINATGTLGVSGRAPKTRESRRRRRRGDGVWGSCPLPKKFRNFSSHNGVIWCILGVLFFEIHVLEEKNKTLVKILGVDNTGRPLQVKYWESRPLQPLQR